jgi:hypothetical protein
MFILGNIYRFELPDRRIKQTCIYKGIWIMPEIPDDMCSLCGEEGNDYDSEHLVDNTYEEEYICDNCDHRWSIQYTKKARIDSKYLDKRFR